MTRSNVETLKSGLVYIVLMTWLLAWVDWKPIHWQWWHDGQWPAWAGESWADWSRTRQWVGGVLCAPCMPLAESYYYVLMDVEAGTEEQAAVHAAPRTPGVFWWGQGEGRPWRAVPVLALYLYWLPYMVLWGVGWREVGRLWRALNREFP